VLLSAACATAPVAGRDGSVHVQVLAINDFHGWLEPPSGGSGRVGSTPAGGIEFLATHLAQLRAANPNTLTVSAGDNIGASPLLSGLFHDEPTVEALGVAGLALSAVGNHELDEGWVELLRMQNGGCHPRDGCQDGTPFDGARFQYLSANVHVNPQRADPATLAASGWKPAAGANTLFPPYAVREFDGVKVGFIGLTLRTAPDILAPPAIQGLTFEPEAQAANAVVRTLQRQGVRAIVVMVHEGARPLMPDAPCETLGGEIIRILRRLSSEVDVVVSGHSHRSYICTVGSTLFTSAESFGRLVTDIDLTIDRRSGQVIGKSARNVVVTRDVAVDAAETALLAGYRTVASKEALRVVGRIAAPVSRDPNAAGESPLGDVVADGMLQAARAAAGDDVALALMNDGGIRADLTSEAGDGDGGGDVTYADLFRVLPFGNELLVKTLTGGALLRLLEQQFDNPSPGNRQILQVSNGFAYAYSRERPPGQRVDRRSVRLNGVAIDPRGRYRVVMPDFVWSAGDRFTVALEGTDTMPVDSDLEAFVRYLEARSPVTPRAPDRIRREP
jgi:5'-nucleotidase